MHGWGGMEGWGGMAPSIGVDVLVVEGICWEGCSIWIRWGLTGSISGIILFCIGHKGLIGILVLRVEDWGFILL